MESVYEQRKVHIDLLRIFACFSVVMLHSASQYWYDLEVGSFEWLVCNSYDAAFRFGVAIFVMISGMLFLGREGEVELKKLYKNNILRLITAYWVWSALYGLWDCREWFGAAGTTWKDYTMEILLGRYHLWFIPMMVGIYVLLPMLKTWVNHASKQQIEYVLILFVILQIMTSSLEMIRLPVMAKVILQFIDVQLIGSYVGYFLLGYYLYKYPVNVKIKKIIYALGVLGLVCAVVVSAVFSIIYGEMNTAAFDSYSIFTFAVIVSVFVFFQQEVGKRKFGNKISSFFQEVSLNTFGVYLIHIWIIEFLQSKGIDSMSVSNVIGIPVLAIFTFVIGILFVALLRRIPVIGKYIC